MTTSDFPQISFFRHALSTVATRSGSKWGHLPTLGCHGYQGNKKVTTGSVED
ncbi:MAG: hypothetical protein ACRDZT_01355 [Acidimicrobiales bacterium]